MKYEFKDILWKIKTYIFNINVNYLINIICALMKNHFFNLGYCYNVTYVAYFNNRTTDFHVNVNR